ncbi:hypothetical protein LZC95_20095 [Pendulispora brunnea]|uniref:Uncharacterized protein n=1 Tax=Pendulispora brunnea TaxID=2905690 RepID=A0ABZ2KPX1_9BACT
MGVLPLACVGKADPLPDEPPATGQPPGPQGCPTAFPVDDATGIADGCGVFVSASRGQDAGDGSQSRPLKSLQKGIDVAKVSGKRVYACAETYPEQIVLAANLSMFGYFDCGSPSWKTGGLKAKIAPSASPVIKATGIRNARVEGFEVVAPDAADGSSVGITAASSEIHMASSTIRAGKGGKGADGADGAQLTLADGSQGEAGLAGEECCAYRDPSTNNCDSRWHDAKVANHRRPRNGGAGQCVGPNSTSRASSPGGPGGRGGLYYNNGDNWVILAGDDPAPGEAANASHAQGGAVESNASLAPGSEGASGKTGTSGSEIGGLSADGTYLPSDGTPGTDGAPGIGGGGGGGRGPQGTPALQQKHCSAVGAGGGAGGCPGLAGAPGRGGGASIGIISTDSSIDLTDCIVAAADGGAGGKGTNGSRRTNGGAGGVAGSTGGQFPGLAGAQGGPGGLAGASGSGGGGPSIGIAFRGTAPILLRSSVTVGAGGPGVPEVAADGRLSIPPSKKGLSVEMRSF